MIFLIWAAVLVLAVVFYIRDKYTVLDPYGIKYLKPVPFFGNMWNTISRKRHMGDDLKLLYDTYAEERFTGRFDFMKPSIIIQDLELIKNVAIKDFENFADHEEVIDSKAEPYFARNLFSLKGQEWKDMRSTLSPAFTSSKIRSMIPFMTEVNDQMMKSLEKKVKKSSSGYIDLDVRDLTTRYTNDVIASCAFGVKLDSHSEEDNDFYTNGKSIATLGFSSLLVIFSYKLIPRIASALKLRMFAKKSTGFFGDLVLNNMKERDVHKIHRPDMIHLLMEAKKGKLRHEEKAQAADSGFSSVEESSYGTKTVSREWTDNDLVAQAVIFFLAGYKTVSSTMSFLLYELARRPDIQDRLLEEIKETDAKNGGKFDLNSVQNMKYMDMVVSEVLRLWPAVVFLNRVCQKDYNIGKANPNAPRDYVIRSNESILLPVWPVHRDHRYFPDPTKFDPERFSDENKGNIKPFTYMPFGTGPRNCIGSRFALAEVKVMIYHLLQKMEISPNEKTPIPPELDPTSVNVHLKGGFWLRFTPRK